MNIPNCSYSQKIAPRYRVSTRTNFLKGQPKSFSHVLAHASEGNSNDTEFSTLSMPDMYTQPLNPFPNDKF